MVFEDREEAGRRLAAALPQFRGRPDTVLLGLARGGIPVAAAAADGLHLPFGALLVRKLGIPGHEETAFGALAYSGGRIVRLLNRPLVARILENGVRQAWLDRGGTPRAGRTAAPRRTYPGIDHEVRGKTVCWSTTAWPPGPPCGPPSRPCAAAGAAQRRRRGARRVDRGARSRCPGSATSCACTCRASSGPWAVSTGISSS